MKIVGSKYVAEHSKQICEQMRWFDFRAVQPPSSGYDFYLVVDRHGIVRVAAWRPRDGYTTGDFFSVPHETLIDGEVFFWAPLPKLPRELNRVLQYE